MLSTAGQKLASIYAPGAVNQSLSPTGGRVDLSYLKSIAPAPMSMRPLPGTAISKAPEVKRAPFVQIAQKVLPKKLFQSFDEDVVSRISAIGRFVAPTFSDQMNTALNEKPNSTVSELTARAKQLDNQTGALRDPSGLLIDPFGLVGSLEKRVVKAIVNKFRKGTSEAFQRADAEVTTQMTELSQAGKRIGMPDGSTRAYSSSFPEWVPSELRLNSLFRDVVNHYEGGTIPKGSRQKELLDLMQKQISEKALEYGDVPLPRVRQMTRSRDIAHLEKSAQSQFGEVTSPRIEAPRPSVPPGKVDTLEGVTQRLLSTADATTRENVKPLIDIIIPPSQTNVKKKVNALDYLRTPDRVLEKIGFGKQAKMLRTAYEDYVKELPKNIDRITEWSKQVPKESNVRIFQALDGKNIQLNPQEQRVAGEIKTWLKSWADRLNLPTDNRISSYITHIFDDDFIQKEFDEDLAKIIADKLPGEVYDPFLEKRLGARGYIQDTWAALDAYVKRATRKVHMDAPLQAIKDKAGASLEFSNIEASQWKYLERYVHGINMRPTELDNALDNTIKSFVGYKFGQRPVTTLTKLLRRMTYRGMLGLNPASALRNLSQGVNTYATLGEKYTLIGYSKMFSPTAHAELEAEGVLANQFITDRTISATKKAMEKIDKGLFVFFDVAERINRGAAYFGAKSKGIAGGMNEEQAVEYAKNIVRKTQFAYDQVDAPVALQSDIVKTLAQFQTYTIKQTEFLAEMARNKDFVGMLRYAAAGTLFVYTIGKAFGMDLKEILPQYRFETPPSLKLPVAIAKAGLNAPDKYGNPRTTSEKLKDIGKSAIGLIPGGNQIKKTYEGYQAMREGGNFDSAGRKQYSVGGTPYKNAQSVIFGQYAGEEAQRYYNKEKTAEQKVKAQKAEESKQEREAIRPTYDQVQGLVAQGKEKEAKAIVDALSDADYEVYTRIRSSERSKNTEAVRLKLEVDPVEAVKFIRSLPKAEAERIVNLLTDDEYALYQSGKLP